MIAKPNVMTPGPLSSVFRSVLFVWALSLPAAHAENACGTMDSLRNPNAMNGGIGGTGAPVPSNKPWHESMAGRPGSLGAEVAEGGIGGTGAPAQANEPPPESIAGRPGIGGTGVKEGGIGGTGLIGVITGFASICVNGVEVHYDTSTPVSADDGPTSLGSLAVGQVVAVQATGEGDQLSARSIAVMHMAVGPVGRVDSEKGQLQVLGQSVRVPDRAALSGLQTGHWIQVSGYRLVSGEMVASRVEPIAPRSQAQVTGPMGVALGNSFEMQGTKVNLNGLRLSNDVVSGTEVSVRGQWDGTTLHALAVTVEPSSKNLGRPDRVVLEGYVHALQGNELSLGNQMVTLAPGVRVSGKPGEALAVNQRVQVSGRMGKDRRVTVDRVTVRSSSSDVKTRRVRDKDDDSKTDDKTGDDSSADNSGRSSDDGDSSVSKSGSSDSGGISGSGSDDSGTSGSTSTTSASSNSSDSNTSGTSGSDSSGSSGSSGSSSGSSGKGSSGKGSSGKGSSGGSGSGGGKK
jgi:hypothetical protein